MILIRSRYRRLLKYDQNVHKNIFSMKGGLGEGDVCWLVLKDRLCHGNYIPLVSHARIILRLFNIGKMDCFIMQCLKMRRLMACFLFINNNVILIIYILFFFIFNAIPFIKVSVWSTDHCFCKFNRINSGLSVFLFLIMIMYIYCI